MLKDTKLESDLLEQVSHLERLNDAVGPTPVRRKVSALLVEIRKTIVEFDQDTFEAVELDPSLTSTTWTAECQTVFDRMRRLCPWRREILMESPLPTRNQCSHDRRPHEGSDNCQSYNCPALKEEPS